MDLSLAFVVPVVILVTPLILVLAVRQDKKTKNTARNTFAALLLAQLLSGFFNWENFSGPGRSGYTLALAYPQSLMFVFFLVSFLQLILLAFKKYWADVTATIANLVNTVMVFVGILRLDNLLEFQPASWANVTAIFIVLFGNIAGLILVNRDKNLLTKWPR